MESDSGRSGCGCAGCRVAARDRAGRAGPAARHGQGGLIGPSRQLHCCLLPGGAAVRRRRRHQRGPGDGDDHGLRRVVVLPQPPNVLGNSNYMAGVGCWGGRDCLAVSTGWYAAASTDGGSTWSQSGGVPIDANVLTCVSPGLCVAGGAYYDSTHNTSGAATAVTLDGGKTWSGPHVLPGASVDAIWCSTTTDCVAAASAGGKNCLQCGPSRLFHSSPADSVGSRRTRPARRCAP